MRTYRDDHPMNGRTQRRIIVFLIVLMLVPAILSAIHGNWWPLGGVFGILGTYVIGGMVTGVVDGYEQPSPGRRRAWWGMQYAWVAFVLTINFGVWHCNDVDRVGPDGFADTNEYTVIDRVDGSTEAFGPQLQVVPTWPFGIDQVYRYSMGSGWETFCDIDLPEGGTYRVNVWPNLQITEEQLVELHPRYRGHGSVWGANWNFRQDVRSMVCDWVADLELPRYTAEDDSWERSHEHTADHLRDLEEFGLVPAHPMILNRGSRPIPQLQRDILYGRDG